jgi:hypothetical protein
VAIQVAVKIQGPPTQRLATTHPVVHGARELGDLAEPTAAHRCGRSAAKRAQ